MEEDRRCESGLIFHRDWGVPTIARSLLGESEPNAAMIGWNLDPVTVSLKVSSGMTHGE